MAYKRELIINNGSLTSYKKLLKVSDVCQLLDKSKYPATMATNGVTFTNNGDGSITVNGAIADVSGSTKSFGLNPVGDYIPVDNTHKYLGLAMDDVPSGAFIYVAGWKDNSPYHWVHDVGYIGSNGFFYQNTNLNVKYISISVGIFQSATALYNFNVQPQWFDLTEMYGAGNEPKTVAEFKAKFPNELYPYSPRCWVTSYKTGLIAKTKNLFNLATASVGYIDWEGKLNHSEDTITYGLSSDYLECTPNTSYTISAFCGKHPVTNDSTLWCRIAYYDENKQLLTAPSEWFTDTNIDYISATWSAPTNAKYLRATTRWMSPTYREQHPENWVMLEKGTTATDYVPYGYL